MGSRLLPVFSRILHYAKICQSTIQAFGQFCASIPGSMAARAARWGALFTGDHHSCHHSGAAVAAEVSSVAVEAVAEVLLTMLVKRLRRVLVMRLKLQVLAQPLGGAVLGGILSKAGDQSCGKSSENSAGDINKNDSNYSP